MLTLAVVHAGERKFFRLFVPLSIAERLLFYMGRAGPQDERTTYAYWVPAVGAPLVDVTHLGVPECLPLYAEALLLRLCNGEHKTIGRFRPVQPLDDYSDPLATYEHLRTAPTVQDEQLKLAAERAFRETRAILQEEEVDVDELDCINWTTVRECANYDSETTVEM